MSAPSDDELSQAEADYAKALAELEQAIKTIRDALAQEPHKAEEAPQTGGASAQRNDKLFSTTQEYARPNRTSKTGSPSRAQ